MPETGELIHHQKWLDEKIRQFIFYITLECDQSIDRLLIDQSVSVNDYNDHVNGRRLGVDVVIKMEQWPETIKNKVIDDLMQLRIPGVDITQGKHHPDHWHIKADISRADAQPYYTDGLVTPLVMKLNSYFDDVNHRLAIKVLPKRIGLLAQKVPGSDGTKIGIKIVPDDEHFSHRIMIDTSDILDPLWQKLAKALTIGQRTQICGIDLRWYSPFIFTVTDNNIPVSVIGPLTAIRNAIDSVTSDIAPNLGSLNEERKVWR